MFVFRVAELNRGPRCKGRMSSLLVYAKHMGEDQIRASNWMGTQVQDQLDNLNNVKRATRGHFRNKRELAYLKGRLTELEENSKNMNITDLYRGINELQNGYQLSKGTEGRYAYKIPTVLSTCRIIISVSC